MGKKRPKIKSASALESKARLLLIAAGVPEPKREAQILAPRRFRWDMAWPEYKVGLEVHGGQWVGGRHQRGDGFAKDRVKHNLGQLAGWICIEACTDHVNSGEFVRWVTKALMLRGWSRGSTGKGDVGSSTPPTRGSQ